MEPTSDEVWAFMVEVGMREPDNLSEITPPEVRYFNAYKPAHDARKAREAAERQRMAEMWAEAKRSQERAADHAFHMANCRAWGRANGHFVGTRGAIPAAVRKGYAKETGVQL